jgi:hypothetical protein
MELNARLLYGIIATLLTCHLLRLFINRRLSARHLPPRFPSYEPFLNLDWIFRTSLDATNYPKFQAKYGKTYRLSTVFTPLSALVSDDPENVLAMMAPEWGVGVRLQGMKEMLGKGFIDTDGAEWMRARKMLKPGFGRN